MRRLFRRYARGVVMWGGMPAFLCLTAACSTQSRYRVLSFFFDGVPPPGGQTVSAAGTGGGNAAARGRRGPTGESGRTYFHKPYADFQCRRCHNLGGPDGALSLVKPLEGGLCETCHNNIPGDLPYVHAPLLANACDQCHVPHESKYKGLLVASPRDICAKCHVYSDLPPRYHPRLASGKVAGDCLRCHNPHGGKGRFFLREKAPTRKVSGSPSPGRPSSSTAALQKAVSAPDSTLGADCAVPGNLSTTDSVQAGRTAPGVLARAFPAPPADKE